MSAARPAAVGVGGGFRAAGAPVGGGQGAAPASAPAPTLAPSPAPSPAPLAPARLLLLLLPLRLLYLLLLLLLLPRLITGLLALITSTQRLFDFVESLVVGWWRLPDVLPHDVCKGFLGGGSCCRDQRSRYYCRGQSPSLSKDGEVACPFEYISGETHKGCTICTRVYSFMSYLTSHPRDGGGVWGRYGTPLARRIRNT